MKPCYGPLALLLLASTLLASPIERGRRQLEDALRVALVSPERSAGPIAIVVDATPYTQAWTGRLEAALLALSDEPATTWRIGRLGEPLLEPRSGPHALAPLLPEVLAQVSRQTSTLPALRRTLRSFRDRGGTILYLADWHFEDDEGLESLLDALQARGQRLSVVGSEAAFGRGWHDGIGRMGRIENADRIGRNAFRTQKAGVPWHGGETAYNHVPHLFGVIHWKTEFFDSSRLESLFRQPEQAQTPEDLRERLDALNEKPPRAALFPLPSSFGPYGLMRLAQNTGGRYVLWSWNPSGRGSVRYDYARCDLFAPDLRSRSDILADLRVRPTARALVRAWHEVARRQIDLVKVTPPLARDLATPQSIDPTPSSGPLNFGWRAKAERDQFLKRSKRYLAAAQRALEILEKASRGKDAIDRRYAADADLFAHTLSVQLFSLGEARTMAEGLSDQAWSEKDVYPALRDRVFIPETKEGGQPFALHWDVADRPRAEALLKARGEFLQRYWGTPFAETVRRNRVVTYELTRHKPRKPTGGELPGRMPAFSEREDAPPTGPGGGSSSSSPSSG